MIDFIVEPMFSLLIVLVPVLYVFFLGEFYD